MVEEHNMIIGMFANIKNIQKIVEIVFFCSRLDHNQIVYSHDKVYWYAFSVRN